jgi:hypothetical protein
MIKKELDILFVASKVLFFPKARGRIDLLGTISKLYLRDNKSAIADF